MTGAVPATAAGFGRRALLRLSAVAGAGFVAGWTWGDGGPGTPDGARLVALDREDLTRRWTVRVFDPDGPASIGSIAPVGDRIFVSGTGVAMLE